MRIPLISMLLVLGAVGPATGQRPDLDEEPVAALRATILPTEEERAFERIPWRTVLWDAVLEANEADRPVLMWAMNGHPLGCT